MSKIQQWEIVQQKAFTRWINAHLRKREMQVTDLLEDLKDGVLLINLYEIIADEKLGKYYPKPQSKFHKIANLNLIVNKINSFVSSVGIRVQFGAEQILEGVKQQVLGMIWCMIHKFEIQDISEEELSAREGLLLWCKKKTKGYPDVKVDNFNYSWEDGLAFAALIHKHRPDLLNFDDMHANRENKKEVLQQVFDIAEKELDIPTLLDADDMVNYKPDDKAVMAQVAYYWKKFSSGQKAEKAGRTIGNAAKKQRELEELQHDYEKRAKILVQWIADSCQKYEDAESIRKECNNLQKVLDKNSDFKDFKSNQKPPRLTEKNDLEVLLSNIRNKQKVEGLPVYDPPEDLTTANIQAQWGKLDQIQEAYDKVLQQHISLMKRLEILLERFNSRSGKLSEWQQKKIEIWDGEDPRTVETLSALQSRVKLHENYKDELTSVEKSVSQLRTFAEEIINNEHESSPEVKQSLDQLDEQQSKVNESGQNLSDRLAAELKRREELVAMCLDYSRLAEKLNLFLQDATLSLIEPVRASSVKDVEIYQNVVDSIEKDHQGDYKTILEQVTTLDQNIRTAEGNPKAFSNLEVDQLTNTYNQVQEQVNSKKQELEKESTVQQHNASLLAELQSGVDSYNDFINKTKDLLTSSINEQSSLEDQKTVATKISTQAIEESNQKFTDLQAAFKSVEEADIAEQSPVTMQALTVLSEQLPAFVKKTLENIEEGLIAKKASKVSPEQINEFREVFNHFDKDRDSHLTKLDFKACLSSLGEDIPDDQLNETFAGYDTNGDGKISFDEFIEFMIMINKESTGYDDVLSAFQSIAEGQDTVTENQLRAVMEKDEVDYLLSKMPKVGDAYDYKTYLSQTYGQN